MSPDRAEPTGYSVDRQNPQWCDMLFVTDTMTALFFLLGAPFGVRMAERVIRLRAVQLGSMGAADRWYWGLALGAGGRFGLFTPAPTAEEEAVRKQALSGIVSFVIAVPAALLIAAFVSTFVTFEEAGLRAIQIAYGAVCAAYGGRQFIAGPDSRRLPQGMAAAIGLAGLVLIALTIIG
jgi:hypothetical protein